MRDISLEAWLINGGMGGLLLLCFTSGLLPGYLVETLATLFLLAAGAGFMVNFGKMSEDKEKTNG